MPRAIIKREKQPDAKQTGVTTYNFYRGENQETGEGCSTSPGDYWMYSQNELLPITLYRHVNAGVVMPDGEEVDCWGWATVGEPVTRALLERLRAEGGRFRGDSYTRDSLPVWVD